MKSNIENALHLCGRDRVLHREFGGAPSVAIRYDGPARIVSPDGTQAYLVRDGASLDEAGAAAAKAFAESIRNESKRLEAWAANIERALHVDDESRCAVCGWPLKERVEDGCTRGNCSHRPRPERLYAPERAAREWQALTHGRVSR